MARLGLFPQGDIYRLREEVIKYLWFNKAYKDSQGLWRANPKYLDHCQLEWNFFLRYHLSETAPGRARDEQLWTNYIL